MQRCPCCRARLNKEPQCPRCKADLSLALSAGAYADYWRQQAVAFYLNDQRESCLSALDQSLRLEHNAAVWQFKQFVSQRQLPLNDELRHLCIDTWLHARPVLQRLGRHLENQIQLFLDEHPPVETGQMMYQRAIKAISQISNKSFG